MVLPALATLGAAAVGAYSDKKAAEAGQLDVKEAAKVEKVKIKQAAKVDKTALIVLGSAAVAVTFIVIVGARS